MATRLSVPMQRHRHAGHVRIGGKFCREQVKDVLECRYRIRIDGNGYDF